VVRTDVTIDDKPIGYTDDTTPNPEIYGDLVGPLDGSIDPLSGHGTFIAGLVHQTCPDADIYAWRVVKSRGPLVETDWVNALTQVVELVRRYYEGDPGGLPIDVLNLSMGYYQETAKDRRTSQHLRHLINVLGKCGTTVVCSAGNDSTALPQYPAAFCPWYQPHEKDEPGPVGIDGKRVPVVSVGALNPNQNTVALFSNTGPSVRTYAPGVSVVSTMPPLQGGLEPMARTTVFGFDRESLDLDNFTRGEGENRRGGFAVWSGTSFAAPVVAGRIARHLGAIPKEGKNGNKGDAVSRGWDAVEKVTTLKR